MPVVCSQSHEVWLLDSSFVVMTVFIDVFFGGVELTSQFTSFLHLSSQAACSALITASGLFTAVRLQLDVIL